MKFYFVRHGQTFLNKYKRMQGWADAPLTTEGEEVALETGDKLADIEFDAVYTSDLGRTQATAHLILSRNQAPKEILPMKAFRESCFGSFEGEKDQLFYQQVAAKHGISLPQVFTDLDMETISSDMLEMDSFKDAELFSQVLKRVLDGLDSVVSQQKDCDQVLIVTHGNIIRSLINHWAPDINVMTEIKNSSVTIVEYAYGNYTVTQFNQ
ncbi:TPA: histidine phosphatase family protein [Streptococcus suis]